MGLRPPPSRRLERDRHLDHGGAGDDPPTGPPTSADRALRGRMAAVLLAGSARARYSRSAPGCTLTRLARQHPTMTHQVGPRDRPTSASTSRPTRHSSTRMGRLLAGGRARGSGPPRTTGRGAASPSPRIRSSASDTGSRLRRHPRPAGRTSRRRALEKHGTPVRVALRCLLGSVPDRARPASRPPRVDGRSEPAWLLLRRRHTRSTRALADRLCPAGRHRGARRARGSFLSGSAPDGYARPSASAPATTLPCSTTSPAAGQPDHRPPSTRGTLAPDEAPDAEVAASTESAHESTGVLQPDSPRPGPGSA